MTRAQLRGSVAAFFLSMVATALIAPAEEAVTPAPSNGFVLFPSAPRLAIGADNAAALPDDQVFVHPVTSPYFHEDSFVGTDVRLWYAYHTFSNHSILNGGEADVLAAQVRVAITPDLQLVAYKDGYDLLHPGLFHADGWNDIAAGLKWSFLHDQKDQLYAAVGVGYQLPWGESKVLQNKEEIRFWGSVDKGFDALHIGGTFNYFMATGADGLYGAGDSLSGDVHIDYYVCKFFSPVVEANVYHVTRSHNPVLPIQGGDVTNLGDGAKDDIWTIGAGFELRPVDRVAIRAAYEKNVSHPSDIFDSRITVSAIFSL